MINNFEKLVERDVVHFSDPDLFYFVQLIKRKKENPNLKRSQKVIRSYYIDSYADYYGKLQDSIIRTCDENNARAYIRVNRRSYFKSHIEMIKYLAELLSYQQYTKVRTAYDTVLGRSQNEPNKKWIIDVDYKDMEEKYETIEQGYLEIGDYIHTLLEESGNTMYGTVPTPNGLHIITGGFNSSKFAQEYPDIDIHKDNPTILYTNLTNK
jgi:hypothetical protein